MGAGGWHWIYDDEGNELGQCSEHAVSYTCTVCSTKYWTCSGCNGYGPIPTSCTKTGTFNCTKCTNGKITTSINCIHRRSSSHSYCSHGNVSQH